VAALCWQSSVPDSMLHHSYGASDGVENAWHSIDSCVLVHFIDLLFAQEQIYDSFDYLLAVRMNLVLQCCSCSVQDHNSNMWHTHEHDYPAFSGEFRVKFFLTLSKGCYIPFTGSTAFCEDRVNLSVCSWLCDQGSLAHFIQLYAVGETKVSVPILPWPDAYAPKP